MKSDIAVEETKMGIDAQLPRGGQISGRVTDRSGNGIPNVDISVGFPNVFFNIVTRTNVEGYYAMNAPAGDNPVEFDPWAAQGYFLPEIYNNAIDRAQSTLVQVVTGGTKSDINAELEIGGIISGRVSNPSGTGIPNVMVNIDVILNPSHMPVSASSTFSDGSYNFKVPAGDWRVAFNTPVGGPYLPELYDSVPINNWNVAALVTVGAGNTTRDIDATLDLGGIISGYVTDISGQGLYVVPRATDGNGNSKGSSGLSLPNNNYALTVPAGSYKIGFDLIIPGGPRVSKWYNNKLSENEADWVTVASGQTLSNINVVFAANNTASGDNVNVQPVDPGTSTAPVEVIFSNVSNSGETYLTISQTGPAPPAGFQLGDPPTYYNIGTTATYNPPITVCITYDPGQYTDPSALVLFHYEDSGWRDITTSRDAATHRICGQTFSLSPFVVAQKLNINRPPVAVCQNVTGAANSSCNADASINNGSYDPDGDSITLIQSPAGPYSKGTTPVTLIVTDAKGALTQCTASVTVVDNTPPQIVGVSANPSVIWPPNKKMVEVTVNYSSTDNCGQPVCQISGVTSNESISSSDYAFVDAHHVQLRADRSGSGNGRIYTIAITCTDGSGNSSSQAVTVRIPHDQGK